MDARDDRVGEQLSEDVRVQHHVAGDRDGSEQGVVGQDHDYEDVPSSGEEEEEEDIALLGKSEPRESEIEIVKVKDKEGERTSMEQLDIIEENEKNEKRQQIVETSHKVAGSNQELCKVVKKEQREQISGGVLEANLLSRGVSGLYCLLVIPLLTFTIIISRKVKLLRLALFVHLSAHLFVWKKKTYNKALGPPLVLG